MAKRTKKTTTRSKGRTTTTHKAEKVDPLYDTPPPRARRPAEHPAVKKRAKKAPAPLPDMDEPEVPENSYAGAGIDLPDLDMEPVVEEDSPNLEDQFDTAVRMAFIGAGQGGGRIAEAFHKLGYGRVCAVNTTDQDLRALDIPGKLVIGNNRGGAGKDPESGRAAVAESAEDIMDLMMRCWGEGVEQVWVCVGAGGGSGTGSWAKIVDLVHEFCSSTDIEKPGGKHVGVIMTMPKRSEGARVQTNAFKAIKEAMALSESKRISSLILVDNARIHQLFPRLPVKRFWSVANTNFAACLHTFNILAAQNSEYNCLDAETEALTQRGWVKGFDLDPHDILLTKNAETGELVWQGMTDLKLWPEYEGKLVEISTRTLSAVSTPDHRWLVTNYKGEDVCKVTQDLSTSGHDRIHRTGVYRGPNSSPWTDDFVELVGWFLTDGTCQVFPEKEIKLQKNRTYAGDRVRVLLYQSERANPQKVARIDSLVERLGCSDHRGVREEDGRVTWRLDRSTAEVLHALFPERVLTPAVASRLTSTQAKILLESMRLGDGNNAGTDNRQRCFTSGKEAGIDAFQMLCTLAGWASTSRWRDMSEYEPQSEKLTNVPKMDGVWVSTVLRRHTSQLEKEHVREFEAKEGVWCPVLPNTYFVARRKGTVYVTGNTFDRADFRSVLRNGLMIFGMTRVHKWMATEDISQAVRKNLAGTLLAEGFDLSTADIAGAIIVAHDSILEEIPMENIDYAFNSLGRVLGNEGITLHNGIYEGQRDGMRVFTIISGLEPPKERLEELEALSV